MKNKLLWAAVGLLVLANAYTLYENNAMRSQIVDLSLRLDSDNGQLKAQIKNVSGVLENNKVSTDSALKETMQTVSGILENSSSRQSAKEPAQSIRAKMDTRTSNEKTVPIVAVASDGTGVMGNLTVKLMPGSGKVLINTDPLLEADLQSSANTAVKVAQEKTGLGKNDDYLLEYQAGDAQMIGGGSAGAAATIASIAALENRTLRKDVAITGTIEADGKIGKIAGQMEKAKAASDAGYKIFLVPDGQSNVSYLEKQIVQTHNRYGMTVNRNAYVVKSVDLKKTALADWGLDVEEVSNIEEAESYMLG